MCITNLSVVLIYLLTTILVGLKSRVANQSIKEYMLGGGNFSTFVMVATIVATNIGGTSTLGLASEVFKHGMIFSLVFISGYIISKFLLILGLADRINRFKGCASVGDIIGVRYGVKSKVLVGMITTISGIANISVQILAMGYIFNHLLQIDNYIGMIISVVVITIYSSFGGMRSVIATDLIQFIVLVIAIPLVFYLVITKAGGYNIVLSSDYNIIGEYKREYWALLLSVSIPSLYPAMIQRFLISKNANQVKNSIKSMMVISIFIYLMVSGIGIGANILYPNIDPSQVVFHVVQNVLPIGLKGIVIAGLLAVIMSTADSELHATTVALVNDVIFSKFKINQCYHIRYMICTMIAICSCALLIAMQFTSLIEARLFANLLWYPIMLFPIIFAIFGKGAHDSAFIISAVCTSILTILWHCFYSPSFASSIVMGLVFNFVIFLTLKYIVKT